MGVDYTAYLIFGTKQEIWDLIPLPIRDLYDWGNASNPVLSVGESISEHVKGYITPELYEDFKDLTIWSSRYAKNAGIDFEALGFEMDPETRSVNVRTRKRIEVTFVKYGLGQPKMQTFAHQH